MKESVEALEKACDRLSETLFLLSRKPEEHIEGVWHDVVLNFEEILSFARAIDHGIFMKKTSKLMRDFRNIPDDIRRFVEG